MQHATTAGRRVAEAETAGVKGAEAKARTNIREKEDTPRASTDIMAATTITNTTTAATREDARS